MMAGYHATVSPADRFRNIDGVLALQLKNGVLVVFAPADFVFWTKRLENKVNTLESALNKMAGISGKEFWITGKFGPTARKNFESKGWMLKEDANAIFLK